MEAIRIVEAGDLKKDRGGFRPGDTVKVMVKVVEGEKERLQAFEGVVIRKRGGDVWSAGELDAALRPWSESIGDRRFETETVWREKMTAGKRSAVEILARELKQGLNA